METRFDMDSLLKGVKSLGKSLSQSEGGGQEEAAHEGGEGGGKKKTVEDLSQTELVEVCRKQALKLRQLQAAYNQLSSKCTGRSPFDHVERDL